MLPFPSLGVQADDHYFSKPTPICNQGQVIEMRSNLMHKKGLRPDASVSAAIDRTPRLTTEQESELILKAQQGDHVARQQVIQANLAWICSLGGSLSGRGLEDDELVSEGTIGLNEAIDRWNPEEHTSIRTYGQYWILKLQGESLFQVDPIRIPKSAHEQIAKLRKVQRKIGDETTLSELAQQTQIREKRILELQSISQPSSLNVRVGRGEQTELLDLQADEPCENTEQPLSPELQNLVQRLDPRQQEVIRLRFLEGWTFKDIGSFFSLTSQRIQQICKVALKTLKGWLVGGSDEPIVEPAPVPQRWQHYVFAKIILATEFCRRSLKRKLQNHLRIIPIPLLFHSHSLVRGDVIEHESSPLPVIPELAPTEILNHHIDSGGLRDGPKHLLDYCWHGISCIARFLGNWPGTPRGSIQHRCRSGDRWRCRGETERYQKKKVRLKIYPRLSVARIHKLTTIKEKPRIEYSNSIQPFSRNLVFLA